MLEIYQDDMCYDTALKLINKDRNPRGYCLVHFADQTVKVNVRIMIMHLPFWQIYRALNCSVKSEHLFFLGPPFNNTVYRDVMYRIYQDTFDENAPDKQLIDVKKAMWQAINDIDDFGTMELGEYICTFSAIDLSSIVTHPKIKEITDIDIDEKNSPIIIKQRLSKANDALLKILSDRKALPDNALCDFLEVNALKSQQLSQTIISYGLRTEVNDRVIRRPVYGSSLRGYRSILDYAIDNLAARKNVYYNHDAIKQSQYLNRVCAIIASILRTLYREPCGTTVLLPWKFTEQNYARCYGKYFVDPETQTEHALMPTNFEQWLDKPVNMYSPITCRHTDGICQKCFGMLALNHTPGINIGIVSSSNAVSEFSQLILSSKHVDQATPKIYVVPAPANDFFRYGQTGMILTASVAKLADHLEIGFYNKDIHCSLLGDLQQLTEDLDVPESKYSEINSVLLRDTQTGSVYDLVMRSDQMAPFLAMEFLCYIRDNVQSLRQERDVVWVPLNKFDTKKKTPIMKCMVYNNSMMTQVKRIEEFIKKSGLPRFKNASDALTSFSELVFDKVKDLNIAQLETIVRAHMVRSMSDVSLPVVDDPANVIFRKTEHIIADRTIAGQLVYETHVKHFTDPNTYIKLHEQSVFDPFFAI